MQNFKRLEHHSIATHDMWGYTLYYSVREYEQEYEDGIREREADTDPGLHWTECLPRIEHLSPTWHEDGGLKIKIVDVDLYHQQMREFLFLA